jgi:hypothetical protein
MEAGWINADSLDGQVKYGKALATMDGRGRDEFDDALGHWEFRQQKKLN